MERARKQNYVELLNNDQCFTTGFVKEDAALWICLKISSLFSIWKIREKLAFANGFIKIVVRYWCCFSDFQLKKCLMILICLNYADHSSYSIRKAARGLKTNEKSLVDFFSFFLRRLERLLDQFFDNLGCAALCRYFLQTLEQFRWLVLRGVWLAHVWTAR